MSDEAWEIRREQDRWRACRLVYRAGLGGLFVAVAFYFGPNCIMFRKLTWITPADFRGEADAFVPVVRAVKAYRRDHGQLPDHELAELQPLPVKVRYAYLEDNKVTFLANFGHL